MSSYFLAKDSLSPFISNELPPSCHIKGRMIPYEEFLPRLKNYCLSLGFRKPIVTIAEPSVELETMSVEDPPIPAENNTGCPGNDSVIILSARVPYEPSWGVYSGLPRPLIHETTCCRNEGTTSNFIAPYLGLYRFAQKHIYLTCHERDQYLIVLPSDLINGGEKSEGKNIKILLDKIVEPDEKGCFSSHSVSDSFVSFPLSAQFLDLLKDNGFSWIAGKTQKIGDFLAADLFVFEDIQQPIDCHWGKSPFVETLLPFMNRIVTNTNPQLLAATIHLQSEFSRAIDDVLHNHGEKDAENLLCIAGLDIDAAAFRGKGEHYFVPWTAFLQLGGRVDEPDNQLEQDDLFVALMAQEKQ